MYGLLTAPFELIIGSSTAIDTLLGRRSGFLAYFYFSFRRSELQDERTLISGLIMQLVRSLTRETCPNGGNKGPSYFVPRSFYNLYKCHHDLVQPRIEDLRKAFRDILWECGETHIIIDALDECPLHSRQKIIEFLSTMMRQPPTTSSVRVMMTSRPNADIKEIIEQKFGSQSMMPLQSHSDIERHIQSTLLREPMASRGWPDPLKQQILNDLLKKADGMFLYVSCQLAELENCYGEDEVREALDQLPGTMDEYWIRILNKIPERQQVKTRAMLQWLAFSQRRLTIEEVAEAAIINPVQHPSVRPGLRYIPPMQILQLLSHMVIEQNGKIEFAHFSVKEFLISRRSHPEAFYRIAEDAAHFFLLQSCLAYIDHYDQALDNGGCGNRYPLLVYACQHWYYHARSSPNRSQEIVDRTRSNASMLHALPTRSYALAASLASSGLIDSADDLPHQGFTFDEPSALIQSSASNKLNLVKLLLDAGSDTEARNWSGMTALLVAVKQGFEMVVRLLLAHQINIEVANQCGQTAIYLAIQGQNRAIATSLLSSGALVNVKTHKGRTALMKSVSCRDEGLLDILVRRGASCKEKDIFGWTALHLASKKGNRGAVEALLKDKSTLDIKTNGGQTALMISARHGHETIVQDLILASASLDEQDVYGRTALYLAAENSECTTEILLKFKANMEIESNRRQTALMTAASHGLMPVVRILLNAGASNEKQNEGGWTALQLAIGHMKALEGYASPITLEADTSEPWSAWKTSLLQLGEQFNTKDEGTNPKISDLIPHQIYYNHSDNNSEEAFSTFSKSSIFSRSSTDAFDADRRDEGDLISFLALMQNFNLDLLPVRWQPHLGLIGVSGTALFSQSSISSQISLVFKRFCYGYSQQDYRIPFQEIECLAHPVLRQHPNIMQVVGVCFDIRHDRLPEVQPVLVFERAPLGDLGAFIASRDDTLLLVEDRLRLCSDIGSALMTLHTYGESEVSALLFSAWLKRKQAFSVVSSNHKIFSYIGIMLDVSYQGFQTLGILLNLKKMH